MQLLVVLRVFVLRVCEQRARVAVLLSPIIH
jgi:hypothetical protein